MSLGRGPRSLLPVLLWLALVSRGEAQVAVGGGVIGNIAGGGAAGGVGGISIDAQGVVKPNFATDNSPDLFRKRREAAMKQLSQDVMKKSPLRKVSLVRLEAAMQPYLDEKKDVTAAMNYLAGLQQIEYVFLFPESKDIVIAGPAEGFMPDAVGRVVGMSTGRPPLRLDDLMVAFRVLERGGSISCSIDPVPDRLAALNKFIKDSNPRATREQAIQRYQEMANILGKQDVRVTGVPPETHFAQVLVEADYRMKMLAVGLENVNVRGFKSHLAIAPPRARSMQRWWMTPLYESFQTTEDRQTFQFQGQRVQLMSAEEVVDVAGKRSDAAFTRLSTEKWAQLFTDKLPEIAAQSPVFAELQNAMDLAVLAALLKKERAAEKVGWKKAIFLDAERATVQTGPIPRQVPTMYNSRVTNQGVITGMVGGGVTIVPMDVLREANIAKDDARKLKEQQQAAHRVSGPEEHPWWWD